MMKRRFQKFATRVSLPVVAAIGLGSLSTNAVMHGQEASVPASQKQIQSIRFASVDADFYYGVFQIGEQWKRFLNGPVVREFVELPAYANALAQFRTEWKEREGFGAQARVVLDNGNAKEALAFLADLFSTEVFITGDKNMAAFYESFSKWNDELQLMISEMNANDQDAAKEQAAIMITKMIERLDKTALPTFLVGGKCENEDQALGKIDQLETLIFGLQQFNEEAAKVLKNLKRVEDNRGNRLVWTYSGTQIPWDSIPVNESFDEETRDTLREVLEKKRIAITIGLLDGFFVFGVSPTPDAILDTKNKTLLDHSELGPVREAISLPITSVAFVSDAMAKANFNSSLNHFFSRNVANNLRTLTRQLGADSELKDFAKDIVGDCAWLDDSIFKLVPEAMGSTSVGYLTNDGWERHDHLRTKNVLLAPQSTLPALEHVGGDPMFLLATKTQYHPEYFKLIREIVQRGKARFDKAALLDWTELGSDVDLEETKEKVDMAWPFLVKLADIWEKKLSPSMSGEHTVVMSAGNLAAKQWFKEMPPSDEALPLPEFASIAGIQDESLFKSGCEELFALFDDLVELIKKENPNSIPAGYKIPRPIKSKSDAGEKYGYPIPADCPVPPEMMPQVVFSGKYLIESYSDKQTAALATVKKLAVGKGIIDADAKQSVVSYMNVGRIFDFTRPWFRYALSESLDSLDDSILDESLGDTYEGYELTGKDLLAAWNILSKIGEIVGTTDIDSQGVTHVRSVYRSQKSQ